MRIKILNIILILSCIALVFRCRNKNHKIHEQSNLIESLQSGLKTWKDKDSLDHAKIQIIETSRERDFLKIQSKDSTITELQDLLKKSKINKRGSVTVIKTSTKVNTKTQTQVKDDIYLSHFNLDNWVIGNTIASRDSTEINLKIKNDYSVVIGNESQGWFKKPKMFVEVTNNNPYTDIKTLRTYKVVSPREKKFGLGPIIGYGIGSNTTGVFIGIGLQYSLIKL